MTLSILRNASPKRASLEHIGYVSQQVFSGGEVQVRLPVEALDAANDLYGPGHRIIDATIKNSDDMMALLLTTQALREQFDPTRVSLRMKYVPYARQDRACAPGEANSIRVLAAMVNGLKFDAVEVWDPHSDVTPALIDNCKIVSQADIIAELVARGDIDAKNTIVVSPDAGALKKVYAVTAKVHDEGTAPFAGMLIGSKHRDPVTGNITDTSVGMAGVHLDDLKDKRLLIVDDICDGGRTFIELHDAIGRELRSRGAGRAHLGGVDLYVTHGIFSKGLSSLANCFNRILTVNPWRDDYPVPNGITLVMPDVTTQLSRLNK